MSEGRAEPGATSRGGGRGRRGARPRGSGGRPGATEPRTGATGPRTGRGDGGRRGRDHGDPASRDRVATARAAAQAAARREVVVPPIAYPPELPVSARRDEIAAAIREHQVVIVSGETGSGKTTQLPKILLDLGRGREGQIGHTQPRRIAARSVAERIAEEVTGTSALGGVVGYQVRFTDESSESTLVKVMTDGILLAQIQRDPLLRAYDTLIVDEAHERSLNIDFILGYLKQLLPRRPDLKVVITSATIDSARFAEHFGGDGPAPVIEVSGRTYPVEIRYRPIVPDAVPDDGAPDEGGRRPGAGAPGHAGGGASGRGGASRGGAPPRGVGSARVTGAARAGGGAAGAGVERDLMMALCEAVDELCAEGPGDILVFLSGEREIRDAEEALRGHLGPRAVGPSGRSDRPDAVELLPLYARLSSAEQHRVFRTQPWRRVVLSTNVAETSLTVPGIRYVVDPGTARISRYSKATKVQRLPIEPISQASAAQRSGRCGRVADGIAIRLYSEADLLSRPEFTEPEILRTSLASVILQMIAAGVAEGPDDVASFPFVEPPEVRAVRDGVQLLTELGALSGDGSGARLTEVGRALARIPMDPRLARMVWEAGRRGALAEVIVIAAALSIQDPRERPVEQRAQADQLHARFADPTSDFLTYLNLWHYLRESRRELSGSAFRRLCRAELLNHLRVREWQDVVSQLREMTADLGLGSRDGGRQGGGRRGGPQPLSRPDPVPAGPTGERDADRTGADPAAADHRLTWDADTVHRCLLAGLLSHLGMQETTEVRASAVGRPTAEDRRARRQARNEYLGARGARFAIFPGSPLARKPPAWVMAGELVETSRLWGREVARIQPEWVEELAPHLVRRTHSEPHWSTRQGAAQAYERVLLYGIPVVARRTVLYAAVDPEHARELFIRHALVQGEWTTHHAFFRANRELLEEVAALEARSRRRDLMVDDDALFAFYDARIPESVVSARHFDRWWRTAGREDPDLLTFTPELLLPAGPDVVDREGFPDHWPHGDLSLPLTYQFQPGTDSDGVTVHIPVEVLPRIRPEGFDWMVPGLLDELVVAAIRALPKALRVQLVPAPDTARDVVGRLRAEGPSWADRVRATDMAPSFAAELRRVIEELRGVEIPPDTPIVDRLPAHLRVTFRVFRTDGRGNAVILDEGKDLAALQRSLASHAEQAVRSVVRSAVRAAMDEALDASGRGGRDGAPGGASAGRADGIRPGAPHGTTSPADGPGAADPGSPADPSPDPTRSTPADGAGPPPVAERTGLRTWPADLPELPGRVTSRTASGLTVHGHPALVEEPDAHGVPEVALRVLADPRAQGPAHARGVRRLLLTDVPLATARVTSRWSSAQSLTMAASPYRSTEALVEDLRLAAVTALTPGAAEVRDVRGYDGLRRLVRQRLEDEVHRIAGDVAAALTAARALDAAIRGANSLALLNTLTDIRDHVAELVGPGFVAATPPDRVPNLVRFIRADSHRLDKAAANPHRDAELAWRIHDVQEAWDRAAAAVPDPSPERAAALEVVRWQIEELRVSLFAQQLGTSTPVSEKRIRKALDELP